MHVSQCQGIACAIFQQRFPQLIASFRRHVRLVYENGLTVIAVCLLFLTGREAMAPSRNYEISKIISSILDVTRSIDGLDKGDPIQKVAICDQWGNCIDLRSKTGPNGIVGHVLPVDASEPPRVNLMR